MSFISDLEKSKGSVDRVVDELKTNDHEILVTKGKYPFDVIATKNNITYTLEVKSHPMSTKTGNIAFEIMNLDKQVLSGIMSSNADYWVDEYYVDGNTIRKQIKTNELKKNICSLLKEGKAKLTVGGDGNKMVLLLVPIRLITW